MNPWLTVLVSVIAALAGVAALLQVPALKKKFRSEGRASDADATSKITESALKLVEAADKKADELNQKLAAAEASINQLSQALAAAHSDVASLRSQVDLLQKDLAASKAENERLRTRRGNR